ncbi:asparagine synthase (glutamine-hydrolyzing) [Nitrincola tapanii]|uniref:asparagine synthase (glutamine-hydrolyzing) n=1 Tax=Nitrincola tapanii TaxID=1708751 RepID=A0A5A9W2K7_9GAMM|nr:asparagine synthase (glutamine-hydrolyzing) [Nitrincola tapanii]KAA0874358.1 asparagine synthase (glutamine-hydrolyzing) [Nitrincola tapanii]
MCGILGVFQPGQTPDPQWIEAMLLRLAHRGPDGQGRFLEGPVGLGHARLSIIDLEQGQQPLFSQDERYVLVANGEIYNAPELRADQMAQGYRFRSGSDCEAILPFAGQAPERLAQALEGMFAFALYDRQAQSLTLVRDRFGIKPLYYCLLQPGLAFASEIKALLPCLPTPQVDSLAIARFLQINFNAGEKTAFQGIQRLPPGGYLHMDAQGRITQGVWWSLTEQLARTTPFKGSLNDAVEVFDQKLQASLNRHLRSDVPVGLFLSGGVDSGILATELARLPAQQGRPKAWSLGFESDSVQDEAQAAAEIAQASGLELELIRVNPIDLFQRLVYTTWAADELMGDFASLPTLVLAEAASQSHKVVLSGEGGDEVFAGYGRYRMSSVQRWFYALRAPGSGGFRTRGRFDRKALLAWMRPELRESLQQHWREPFQRSWHEARHLGHLQRMQSTDIHTWLVDDLLVKADRMLMVEGVEGRVPYLDTELALWGLSLPPALKIQGRLGKQVPRAWLAQHQAGVNATGRKKGFSVPVVDWVRSLNRQQMVYVFQRSELIQQGFDLAVVQAYLQKAPLLSKQVVEPLAALLQLAIWEKLFLQHAGRQPPKRVEPLSWLLDSE